MSGSFGVAIDAIAQKKIDVESMVTSKCKLEDAQGILKAKKMVGIKTIHRFCFLLCLNNLLKNYRGVHI